jgi:membrane protein
MRSKTSFLERVQIAASPYERVRRFLTETIWQVDPKTLPRFYLRWGVWVLRVVYLVGRGLYSSRTQLQASALTYTTMLALVPFFAVAFSIFQGLGGFEGTDVKVKGFLIQALAPSPQQEAQIRETLDKLVSNAHNYVDAGSSLAGISGIFLFVTVVSLLSTVEKTMNDVWGVTRSRSFIQKLMTYWALATMGPLLLGVGLVMGSNLNSFLGDYAPGRLLHAAWKSKDAPERIFSPLQLEHELRSQRIQARAAKVAAGETDPTWSDAAKANFIFQGLYPEEDESSRLTSFTMVAIAFTLLYAFMPNTRVKLKPAIIGGFVAAFVWNMSRWGLATSSSSLVKYNTIYGGLATIPIMMFWLYVSWLIVILGADVTFAIQNIGSQGKEELADEASPKCRETVALRLVAAIADAFDLGKEPPGREALAKRLGAPVTLVSQIVFHLCEDGILREIERPDDPGYVPARPLERVTLQDVVGSLHERDGLDFTLEGGSDASFIADQMARARAAHERVAQEVTFDHVVRSLRTGGTIVAFPDDRRDTRRIERAPETETPTSRHPSLAAPHSPPPAPSSPPPAASMPGPTPLPDARSVAQKFAALKASEKTAAPAAPSEPVGAGESEQLAALLGGAAGLDDEPS